MKYIVNFSLLVGVLFQFSCDNVNPETLSYSFELNADKNNIKAELSYHSIKMLDTIELIIPSSYDRFLMKTTNTINNVKLLSSGELIETENNSYQVVTSGRSFNISYDIPSLSNNSEYISCLGDEHFIPHINEKFFHFFGDKALVIPNYDVKKEPRYNVEVEWKGFPEDWHIANDFGITDSNRKQKISQVLLNNIGNTLFFGGDYRKTEIKIDDKTLHLYLFGKWKFDDEVFLEAIEDIAKVEFQMWDHFYHSNEYVISLIQKGADDCGRMTGRNMLDSFSFYLPGKFSEDYLPFFYPQLVHEFTHSWIGVDVIANCPEPSKMKWFTEGFTDYYTLKISRETGFFSQKEYEDMLNEYIRSYLLSPYRSFSIDKYHEGYLFDERLENLAYKKGAVFAFYLDGHIREQTKNQFNLDDLMKALYSETSMEKMNHNLTNTFFANTAKQALGIDISPLLKNYIVKGEMIPIVSPLIDEKMKKDENVFDYGFDYIKSIETEIISGVVKNSNAYDAGLRSGQKFLEIKKMTSNPLGKMILVVSDGKGQKTVEFSPKGQEVTVPIILKLNNDV